MLNCLFLYWLCYDTALFLVTLLFVHPCSNTGYHPHLYVHVNSCDWPVWRREVQLAIASQLNTSWDPSVTFYARSSWLSESVTVAAKSDEAAFETSFRSITSSGRGSPGRRAVLVGTPSSAAAILLLRYINFCLILVICLYPRHLPTLCNCWL